MPCPWGQHCHVRAYEKLRQAVDSHAASGEAIKHVEGRKVVFTAASVAAEPIVILVDLEETFTTSTGSSGHQKSPDERSLTMCRRIHMEMPVGEVCFQELKNVPRDKVLDHLEQLL